MKIADYLETVFSLKGKTIILTGAAGGIGRVLARGLAAAGADMILADIRQAPLDELAQELPSGKHKACAFDIRAMTEIKTFVESVLKEYGKVDVLINCAGINKREGFLDVEEETYDRIMDVNLKGVFFLTQSVVKASMRHTGGKIINLASFNSTSMLGGVSVYGATKSAVVALTRSMAIEWAKYNIQANAIAPGHILTELTQVTWDDPHRSEYLRQRIAAQRPGDPEELVGIIIMLASQASSYLTGSLINVDGGALAGGKPWNFDTQFE